MKIGVQRFGKPYEPEKDKRKKKNSLFRVIAFLLIAIVTIALATIRIETILRHYVVIGQEETWAASTASYWGGIIGGVISGILAFLGVFYTIRYYKESDAQKERAAVQPFLLAELEMDSRHEPRSEFCLGDRINEKEKQKTIIVRIKNIGNGFAKTLVVHTGVNVGGLAFNKVINVDDYTYTSFLLNKDNLKDGLSFALQFVDSMTNEYLQVYTIKEDGIVDIESGYPYLLEQ